MIFWNRPEWPCPGKCFHRFYRQYTFRHHTLPPVNLGNSVASRQRKDILPDISQCRGHMIYISRGKWSRLCLYVRIVYSSFNSPNSIVYVYRLRGSYRFTLDVYRYGHRNRLPTLLAFFFEPFDRFFAQFQSGYIKMLQFALFSYLCLKKF